MACETGFHNYWHDGGWRAQTGRMLYQYRLAASEYDELKEALRQTCAGRQLAEIAASKPDFPSGVRHVRCGMVEARVFGRCLELAAHHPVIRWRPRFMVSESANSFGAFGIEVLGTLRCIGQAGPILDR